MQPRSCWLSLLKQGVAKTEDYECPFLRIPPSDTELASDSVTPAPPPRSTEQTWTPETWDLCLTRAVTTLIIPDACDIVMDGCDLIYRAPSLLTWATFAKRLLVLTRCDTRPLYKCYCGASVLQAFCAALRPAHTFLGVELPLLCLRFTTYVVRQNTSRASLVL
ncbi:hypothetical protein MTO96_018137 [Rhipicephalus appendiculatus]